MLFEDRSLAPYQGDEPYIFLSYSHRNADSAAEVIRYLKAAGFRVWYDEGVIPATQWDENIARAIENCGYMMALISEAYLASSNCLDELNYARDWNKPMLLIYLEDVSLPSGLAMRLGRLLAIHRYRYDNPASFYSKVVRSKGIGVCGDGRFEEDLDDEDEYTDGPFWDPDPDPDPGEKPSVLRPFFLILLALVVAFIAFLLLRGWAGERVHGIFGSGEYTEVLPAPDPTHYETPDTSAEIEIVATPTPIPTETPTPSPDPTPTPESTPEPTHTPTPTPTAAPTDEISVVVVETTPVVTPAPTVSVTPVAPTAPSTLIIPETAAPTIPVEVPAATEVPQPSEPLIVAEPPAESPAPEVSAEVSPTPTAETVS